MPESALAAAGRRSCLTPRQGASRTHRVAREDQAFLASCPGNSPRPLAGRLGGICPGGQYWPPHYPAGQYKLEDTISSTRATHTHEAIKPSTAGNFRGPLRVHGWGRGTGYCPNTASIFGVDWSHKETTDVFHTTYSDTLSSIRVELASGFLSQPDFWAEEGDAPILKFDHGWLQDHTSEAIARATAWLPCAGVEPSRVEVDTTPLSSEGARIFRADANRTFRSEPNRLMCIKLLSFSQQKFGDYQQSLGYVAGLLLLFFDPATCFKVLTVLNDSPKYLPGYWRGEATACAVDGYVCEGLLKPHLRVRLKELGLLPETFVQKWFAGLCIHHLPYSLLFDFLDNFFSHGNAYLFQFFMSFFDEFEVDIMNAANNPEANMLIRFESAPHPRLRKVVQEATAQRYVDTVKSLDVHQCRIAAFQDAVSCGCTTDALLRFFIFRLFAGTA
ncbi:unnamed protein product [Effrenium voratum]|uniref:Rab-GAP TBC domain-containing protein n=1 Tax=Effrenium voratum TaxID=2562239 RepID=A0AA36I6Z9_9DINO|nr:unnamed protein product [Effrenium voratum]